MSMTMLQERLTKLRSSKTKKAGEDVFAALENVELLNDLDENTLEKHSPRWAEVVSPFLVSCEGVGNRMTATIFQFEHLNKVLGLADGRFKEHGATMLSEKFLQELLKRLLSWIDHRPRAHYIVSILLRRLFIHDAYVACMSATLADKLLRKCLSDVERPSRWNSTEASKLVELFKWMLCDSPALTQQRIIHSNNRHKIQEALRNALYHSALDPDNGTTFRHHGTLTHMLRACRAFTLLLAHQGQFALAHWANACAVRLLAMAKSTGTAPSVRTQVVQILRVFLAGRRCADSKVLSKFIPAAQRELPHLLAIARTVALQRLSTEAGLDADHHAFAAFLADLMASLPAYASAAAPGLGSSADKPGASVSTSEGMDTTGESHGSGAAEVTDNDDGAPPRRRAKRHESPITTLLSWLSRQREAAVVVTTYMAERHPRNAGTPFLKQALREALPLLRSEAVSHVNWGLRCAAALLKATQLTFATNSKEAKAAAGPILGLDSEVDVLCHHALSLLRTLFTGTSSPTISQHLCGVLLRVLVACCGDACAHGLDTLSLCQGTPLSDTALNVLFPLLHTSPAHQEAIQPHTLFAVTAWLGNTPSFGVFQKAHPSTWLVAKCLALLCRTKPASPALLAGSSNSSDTASAASHQGTEATASSKITDAATPLVSFDRKLATLQDSYLFSLFFTSDQDTLPACFATQEFAGIRDDCTSPYRLSRAILNPQALATIAKLLTSKWFEDGSSGDAGISMETTSPQLQPPKLLQVAWQAGVVTKLLALVDVRSSTATATAAAAAYAATPAGTACNLGPREDAQTEPATPLGNPPRGGSSEAHDPSAALLTLTQLHAHLILKLKRHISSVLSEASTVNPPRGARRLCSESGNAFLELLLEMMCDRPVCFRRWRSERKPHERASVPHDPALQAVAMYLRRAAGVKRYMQDYAAVLCDLTAAVIRLEAEAPAADADNAFMRDDDIVGSSHSSRGSLRLSHESRHLLASHLAPRHTVELTQALCLDTVHCWRAIACHPLSHFARDAGADLLLGSDVIGDQSCPALVVLAACQSLAQVPPQDVRARAHAHMQVLRVLAHPDFASNALLHDPAFLLPACFNTVLDVIARVAPPLVALASSNDPAVLAENVRHAQLVSQVADDPVLRHVREGLLAHLWRLAVPPIQTPRVRKATRELKTPLGVSQRMAVANCAVAIVAANPTAGLRSVLAQGPASAASASSNAVNNNGNSDGSTGRQPITTALRDMVSVARDRHPLCRIHMARVLPLLLRGISKEAPALRSAAVDALFAVLLPVFNSFLKDDDDDDDDGADEDEDPYDAGVVSLEADIDFSSELQSQYSTSLLILTEVFPIFPEMHPRLAYWLMVGAFLTHQSFVRKLFGRIADRMHARSTQDLVLPLLPGILLRWMKLPAFKLVRNDACRTPLKDTPFWTLPIAVLDAEAASGHDCAVRMAQDGRVLSASVQTALETFVRRHWQHFIPVIIAGAPLLTIDTLLEPICTVVEKPMGDAVLECFAESYALIHILASGDADKRDRIRKLRKLLASTQLQQQQPGDESFEAFALARGGQVTRAVFRFLVPPPPSALRDMTQDEATRIAAPAEPPFIAPATCVRILQDCLHSSHMGEEARGDRTPRRSLGSVLTKHQDSVYDMVVDVWDVLCSARHRHMRELHMRRLAFLLQHVLELPRVLGIGKRGRSSSIYAVPIIEAVVEVCILALAESRSSKGTRSEDGALTVALRLLAAFYQHFEEASTLCVGALSASVPRVIHDLAHLAVPAQAHRCGGGHRHGEGDVGHDAQKRQQDLWEEEDEDKERDEEVPPDKTRSRRLYLSEEERWLHLLSQMRSANCAPPSLEDPTTAVLAENSLKVTSEAPQAGVPSTMHWARLAIQALAASRTFEESARTDSYSALALLPAKRVHALEPLANALAKDIDEPCHALEQVAHLARSVPGAVQPETFHFLFERLSEWIGSGSCDLSSAVRPSLSKLLPVLGPTVRRSRRALMEAAQCLGEMGLGWDYVPAEAEALRTGGSVYAIKDRDRIASVIQQLKSLLVAEEDSRVVVAALRALREMQASDDKRRHATNELKSMAGVLGRKGSTKGRRKGGSQGASHSQSQHNSSSFLAGGDGAQWTAEVCFDYTAVWSPHGKTYPEWMKGLVCTLIEATAHSSDAAGRQYLPLLRVCRLSLRFCEFMLPYVVLAFVSDDPEQANTHRISANLNRHFASVHADVSADVRRATQTLLKLVTTMRGFQYTPSASRGETARPGRLLTHWDNLKWLRGLDYLLVAQAALACASKYSAVLYAEVAHDLREDAERPGNNDAAGNEGGENGEAAFVERFRAITCASLRQLHEPDGLYAFLNPLDMAQHLLVFQHEQEYGKVLAQQDILHTGFMAAGAGRGTDAASSRSSTAPPLLSNASSHGAHGSVASASRLGGATAGFRDSAFGGALLGDTARAQLLTSAHRWGLTSIPGLLCRPESAVQTPEEREYMFESAWRLGQWDAVAPTQAETDRIHKHVFLGLCGVHSGAAVAVNAHTEEASRNAMHRLLSCGLEDVHSINAELTSLQMMTELREAAVVVEHLSNRDYEQAHKLLLDSLKQWSGRAACMPQVFEAQEQVKTLQLTIMELILGQALQQKRQGVLSGHDQHLDNIVAVLERRFQTTVVDTLGLCRRFGKDHHAMGLAKRLHAVSTTTATSIPSDLWLIETAKTLWERNDSQLAVLTIQAVHEKHTLSEATRLMATWMGELRSQTPEKVIELFEESLQVAERKSQESPEKRECQLALAKYTDKQYLVLTEKMKSGDHVRHLEIMAKNKEEVQRHQSTQHQDRQRKRRVTLLKRRLKEDDETLKAMMTRKHDYLTRALTNYLGGLQLGSDNYHDIIFRVCALWFQNTDEEDVQEIMAQYMERLPTYYWLPLIYQLAARLDISTPPKRFHAVLQRLLLDMAVQHPHHVLFVLIALANGDQQGRRTLHSAEVERTPKMQAADELLNAISRTEHPTRDMDTLVCQMRAVSQSYTELATKQIDKQHRNDPEFYKGKFGLASLRNVDRVAVLTKEVAVDPRGEYPDSAVVRIRKWDSTFSFAGGVNLPRILNCHGTDGKEYKEVIKGNDDSRQDAVMQQVFGAMNQWLKKDPDSQRRAMHIRTYKIVPLSSKVGVLEWCVDTTPLGMWLVRGGGRTKSAHERYRPQDWLSGTCRTRMKRSKTNRAEQFATFKDILENFKPVMRRFFTEKFRDPGEWFERRLAYTRSVATNSMVGYIIGLGDRHPNNILIDKKTAELVHIDLGVAFEQGRMLPTPETIPFRLTRDIIDGMGVAGVDGVFRRCCEKCMAVLRKSASPLGTILEVFVHDPLSTWKLTRDRAKALQRADDTAQEQTVDNASPTESVEENEAQKVLIKVRQKLSGFHDGVQLSVQGHVGALIQEATDIHRLAHLFEGWQAWV